MGRFQTQGSKHSVLVELEKKSIAPLTGFLHFESSDIIANFEKETILATRGKLSRDHIKVIFNLHVYTILKASLTCRFSNLGSKFVSSGPKMKSGGSSGCAQLNIISPKTKYKNVKCGEPKCVNKL